MDRLTVDVKIHPTVREFILCTNRSDIITPEKGDWLWLIIKQNLQVSSDYTPVPEDERSHYIRIELLDCSATKTYVRYPIKKGRAKGKRSIYLNTLFRNKLSDYGQNIIATHLRKQFKECFHNYVAGAVSTNPEIKQKDAILSFCETYHITFNSISEDMLIKSWQRSVQRANIFERISKFCPIIF